MCGIAGLYRLDGRVDLGRLHHMGRLLRHRGPDDEGMVLIDPRGGATATAGGPDTPAAVFASGLRWAPGRHDGDAAHATFGLGLLSRRLAIVDLSPTGHQPMCDPAGRTWIAYNGEIYNHVELRRDLEAAGERFVGGSDTEVILAAYRRWGVECLARLNGMFAFALWDGESRRLFAARDRLGVKPFYYQWDGRTLAFASEPRALVLTQPQRVLPDLGAVRDLVALDWVDHDTTTFFEGLRQLPAGHHLIAGADGFAVRRWWDIDPDRHATGSPADWEAEFRDLFTDAVRIRLRANVEVGACLSGGTDSSAVVATAARLMDRPIHAFTCAYDEGPAYDERPYVRAAVEASGAVSHVVVPDGGDFWEVFDALAAGDAEPTAGPGVYSQWKVMGLAHEAGLRVLLDGQGGTRSSPAISDICRCVCVTWWHAVTWAPPGVCTARWRRGSAARTRSRSRSSRGCRDPWSRVFGASTVRARMRSSARRCATSVAVRRRCHRRGTIPRCAASRPSTRCSGCCLRCCVTRTGTA